MKQRYSRLKSTNLDCNVPYRELIEIHTCLNLLKNHKRRQSFVALERERDSRSFVSPRLLRQVEFKLHWPKFSFGTEMYTVIGDIYILAGQRKGTQQILLGYLEARAINDSCVGNFYSMHTADSAANISVHAFRYACALYAVKCYYNRLV